jgi:hypothetical protein
MRETSQPESPRERVENFIGRHRLDAGEFLRQQQLEDGYMRVEFEKLTFFTPKNGRAIYQDGTGYERPRLKETL